MNITASELARLKSEDSKKIPAPMKIVRGSLVPSNTGDAATLAFHLGNLETTFKENKLLELTLWNCEWRDGRLVYGNVSPVYDAPKTDINFLHALNRAMQSEAATALNLSGAFTLIVENGQEPVVMRITVNSGEVSYEEASYM